MAHDTEREGDSPFEVEFVRQVLSRVRRLEPHDVTPQKEVRLSDGRKLRIDFFVDRSDLPPLAIELDGYNKTGRAEDAPAVARADKAKRRQLEQQLRYVVVEFAVKDLADPHPAIRDIETRMASKPVAVATMAAPAESAPEDRKEDRDENRPDRRSREWRMLIAALAILGLVAAAGFALIAMNDDTTPSTPADDGSCPTEASIKGNVSMSGERIFHEPGWRYYDATSAEECFASSKDAEESGYRASQAQ